MIPLTTERLSLREIVASDLNAIHALLSLPETDFYNALGIPMTIEITQGYIDNWVNHQQKDPRILYAFTIENKEPKQFLGLIALTLGKPKYRNAEVWFKIHVEHWRKGFATEAFKELIRFGFNDLRLHRIEAGCAVENIASSKVIEKAGLTLEGTSRKLLPHMEGWLDCYTYAILEEDHNG